MIPIKEAETIIAEALQTGVGCPVIRANQSAPVPGYPYISYTIITPLVANNGTFGDYGEGVAAKQIGQVWSFTAQSDDSTESQITALRAHDYLDYAGVVALRDLGISVNGARNITNRDNFLTVGFEYRNGFDATFAFMTKIDIPESHGTIENADLKNYQYDKE